MKYNTIMRHEVPDNEADLHSTTDTMCPCGCTLTPDGDGNMVCTHAAYNVADLLLAADNLIQNRVAPKAAGTPFKRTKYY